MPKVSKVTLKFRGGNKVYDVWYTDKDNFHIKEFPDEIHRKVGDYKRMHDSVGALEAHYNKVLREYYEMMKQVEPVILYSVWLGEEIRTFKQPSEHGHGSFYVMDYEWIKQIKDKVSRLGPSQCGHSVGITFDVGVLITKKEAEFHEAEFDEDGNVIESTIANYGQKVSHRDGTQLQIPYTREAHLFLLELQEKMKKMGQMLAEFMTDKERLQHAIETKSNLLLTNG